MHRPSRRELAYCLIALTLLVLVLLSPLLLPGTSRFNDYRVFRLGGAVVFHGHLYAARTTAGYPFTYPPFAALCFYPLTSISVHSGLVLWSVLTAVAIVVGSLAIQRPSSMGRIALGVAVACVTIPIRNDIRFAQVEVILAALVLLDLLVMPPRCRGILLGLATAIKLTPGLFIVYLLVTKQRGPALRAAAIAIGAEALGFVVAPHESWTYWTSALFSLSRFGVVRSIGNQSATGVLMRFGLTGHPLNVIAGAISLAVVVVALVRARVAYQNLYELEAIAVIGCATAVASPLSWTHHFTWLLVAFAALTLRSQRSPVWITSTAALALVLCVSWFLHADSFFIAACAVCLAMPTGPETFVWAKPFPGVTVAADEPHQVRSAATADPPRRE